MAESLEREHWNWKLCTRTESKDYFWIDDHMQPTRKSNFFGCVADESNHRTGYFWLSDEHVEIGVNNLDAQRKDRFGRKIFQSILLRSLRRDEKRARLLREIFAEAICDVSKDPVAAVISRKLYSLWETRDTSHSSGDTWPTPVTPVSLPSPDSVLSGWQYIRTPDSLRKFAAAALSNDTNILLLCAATNPVNRIWSAASAYSNIPTAVCAMTVTQDSEYTQQPHSSQIPSSFNLKIITRKLEKFDKKATDLAKTIKLPWWLSIILIVAFLSALALWWHNRSDVIPETNSSTTALQSNDLPSNNTWDAQSPETQREASQGVNP